MIDEMRRRLSTEDLAVAGPVWSLSKASLDPVRSILLEDGSFVRCRFVALHDRHCPFEVHFGRGKHAGRFNFFIGRGAEVANYEPIVKPEELAADLRNFLMSRVVVEGESVSDVVLREEYTADRMVLDGAPLRLVFVGDDAERFAKGTSHRREYAAWLERGEAP